MIVHTIFFHNSSCFRTIRQCSSSFSTIPKIEMTKIINITKKMNQQPQQKNTNQTNNNNNSTNNNKDPNINNLDNFQSKSRLHFIGSWINEATGMIRKLLEEHPEYDHSSFFGEQNIVCHIDMDCFFVLVALSKPENAHLIGRPVAVASGGNYSEISSCSYKAREFGVRAGMWLHEAKKRCPELQLVKYDFDRVRAINQMIYRAAFEMCPTNGGTHMKLQVLSVDEFLVSFDTKNFEVARNYCESLRQRIAEESQGCTASCGIAPNVHVARAVTALAKPNGLKLVTQTECLGFVREMEVDSIHGVGRKMQEKIKAMLKAEKIQPSGVSKKQKKRKEEVMKNGNAANSATTNNTVLPQRRQREGEGNDEKNDDDDDEDEMLLIDDEDDDEEDDTSNNNQNIEDAAAEQPNVILIRDLIPISSDKLKRYLGQAMAEKLHNLAHKALDHTLVVGTGTSDSGALPKAVGTTMNYAVRINQLHEFSALLLQLCKDIEGKLERVGGVALIIKLTVLVRHPEASVETKKHLGCGWCDEWQLGQARAISNDLAFGSAEKMHDTLLPFAMKILYTHNNDSSKNSSSASQQLITKASVHTWQPARKIVVQQDNNNNNDGILITDLRGITLNASSIIPKVKPKVGMTGRKIQPRISIADSFRKEVQKQQQQQQLQTSASAQKRNNNKKKGAGTMMNLLLSSDDDEGDDDDDSEVHFVKSSPQKKPSSVVARTNQRSTSDDVFFVASQESEVGDSQSDKDSDVVMMMGATKQKTLNKNITVLSSQDDEDNDDKTDVFITDSRDAPPKQKQQRQQVKEEEVNQKKTNNHAALPSSISSSNNKTITTSRPSFSRDNPLTLMSVILVAAQNGKIMNILTTKDPKNAEFRKMTAQYVISESALPLGSMLLNSKQKFSKEEIEMARKILE